mgnify:CR=1 FL=1
MTRFSLLSILVLPIAAVIAVWFYAEPITNLMNSGAEVVFGKFKDKNFPLILAAGIVGVGLGLAIAYLLFLVAPVLIGLRSKLKWVTEYPDEQTFADDFDRISQKLKHDRLIGHAWSEFRETVLEPDMDSEGNLTPPVVRNTVRPHSFINAQHLQDHNVALRFMPHLPNYFVGVGLLLTFVGLIAALNFATATVGGNIDEAITGLEKLLKAATFKFWTSVAGLGMSILLSFFFRLYSQWIEEAHVKFCDAVEGKMQFVTPQAIFADMRELEQQQLAETKKINSEVAFTIGNSINENLNQNLPPALQSALQPVTEAVQQTSDAMVNRNTEGVDAMIDKFANTLESGTGTHMKAISETLENLQNTLGAMQGSMDSSGDEFARRMAEGAERLDATMREMSSAVSDLVQQMRTQVNEAGASITSELEQTLGRIAEQSEAAAQSLATQGQSASRAFADNVETAARSLQESADASAKASSQTVEDVRKQLETAVTSMESSVARLSERMQQVDASLGTQAQAFDDIVAQEKAVSQNLQTATTQLRDGVQPWQEAGQTLAQTTQQAETAITEATRQLNAAVETAGTLSESLNQVSERLKQSWESYQERFEKVDADLENAFSNITEALDTQQRRLQDFIKDLDQSFTQATDRLNGTISNMSETAEDLNDTLERWANAAQPNGGGDGARTR